MMQANHSGEISASERDEEVKVYAAAASFSGAICKILLSHSLSLVADISSLGLHRSSNTQTGGHQVGSKFKGSLILRNLFVYSPTFYMR